MLNMLAGPGDDEFGEDDFDENDPYSDDEKEQINDGEGEEILPIDDPSRDDDFDA